MMRKSLIKHNLLELRMDILPSTILKKISDQFIALQHMFGCSQMERKQMKSADNKKQIKRNQK